MNKDSIFEDNKEDNFLFENNNNNNQTTLDKDNIAKLDSTNNPLKIEKNNTLDQELNLNLDQTLEEHEIKAELDIKTNQNTKENSDSKIEIKIEEKENIDNDLKIDFKKNSTENVEVKIGEYLQPDSNTEKIEEKIDNSVLEESKKDIKKIEDLKKEEIKVEQPKKEIIESKNLELKIVVDNDELEKNDNKKDKNAITIKKDVDTFENILNDLEIINDDFAAEIEAQKEKEKEEAKKRSGEEDDIQQEMELKPLENEEKLTDIKNLSLDNIEEFLKNNGKDFCELTEKEKEKEIEETQENDNEGFEICNILNTFKLDEELWNELKFSDELKNKVNKRVKLEIKSFIKEIMIPLLEKLIK